VKRKRRRISAENAENLRYRLAQKSNLRLYSGEASEALTASKRREISAGQSISAGDSPEAPS